MQSSVKQVHAGLAAGTVLAGKYRVERQIGQGGMGMVVVARHLELDELVAIKFLLPEALSNPEAVARFAREARASVKIRSEHVARTLDVGRLENGAPYMVMEYLQGTDLGARLLQSGPLPIEDAVDFTLQTCQALADAHAIGIIHRDIKPANLFVIRKTDGKESVKVLDFGISKLTGISAGIGDMGVTRTQALMGSPSYMSPEEMASARNVGPSADIWALGVTFYELITGRVPFEGETIPELCVQVLTRPLPPLSNWLPEVPAGLEAVIQHCLEKDPARRYANVAEFAVALMSFGTKRGRLSAMAARRVLQTAGMPLSHELMLLASYLPPDISLSHPSARTRTSAEPVAPVPTPPPESSERIVVSWPTTHDNVRRRNRLRLGVSTLLLVLGSGSLAVLLTRFNGQARIAAAAASPQPTAEVAPVKPSETNIEPVITLVPAADAPPPPAQSTSKSRTSADPVSVVPIAEATPRVAPAQPVANMNPSGLSASRSNSKSIAKPKDSDKQHQPARPRNVASFPESTTPAPMPPTKREKSTVTDFGGRLY